jgi:hypothetical protein
MIKQGEGDGELEHKGSLCALLPGLES